MLLKTVDYYFKPRYSSCILEGDETRFNILSKPILLSVFKVELRSFRSTKKKFEKQGRVNKSSHWRVWWFSWLDLNPLNNKLLLLFLFFVINYFYRWRCRHGQFTGGNHSCGKNLVQKTNKETLTRSRKRRNEVLRIINIFFIPRFDDLQVL